MSEQGIYGGKMAFYHPNQQGTGSALQIEPRLNRRNGDRYNCFFADMAVQKSCVSRTQGKLVPATFDWSNKLTVKLDFTDLCEILAVLEGRMPHLGGKRKCLYHANGTANTVISLSPARDMQGWYFSLSRKNGADNAIRINILLSIAEATGLRCVLQTGLFFLLFHEEFIGRGENGTTLSFHDNVPADVV